MKTAYDNHINTQLFLDHAEGCASVIDLFEKIKKIDNTILQGNITEGLVKVMLDSQKFFKMKNVSYAGTNEEGIDITSEHPRKGKISIQVKFRSSETLSNDELNSFGKVNWLNGYGHGYVIGNLGDVPSDWHNDKVSLFLKENFRDINLQKLIEFAAVEKTTTSSGPMTPRGFQSKWLEQMRSNINKMTRGKILGPPGLGKTLGIASYVRMLKKNKIGFIGAPWIRLVNQNMIGVVSELEAHGYNVDYISVHSGHNVNGEKTELNEYSIVPQTTDVEEIREFLAKAKKNKTPNNLYIVFACYGSTERIIEAFKGYRLDYGAFDEAHNLTGHKSKSRPQIVFDKNVKFARRAFVTATEKIYNGKNDEVVAMNNAKLFGGILCFCSFKDAIEHKNIKDYRVVFPNLSGKELDKWWSALKKNLYVQDNGEPVTMDMVALKTMIYAMYSSYPIVRMVAGFNLIDNAKEMSKFLAVSDAITEHYGFVVKSTWVSSKETQSVNNRRISEFADSQDKYVLCAPPMLKEGVDIKGVDKNGKYQYPNAVVFCDNKRGEIGIVQLAGRGFRMGQEQNELCYIGLPIIYHPEKGQEEIYNSAFARAKEVIISLGCSDDRIAQEINAIRAGKSQPKLYKISTKIVELPDIIAESVEFREFAQSINMALAHSVTKASLEEHIEECKKYKNGIEYNTTIKDNKFYAVLASLQSAYPSIDLYSKIGWVNVHGERHSYEKHIEECKKYKSGEEYNRAKKDPMFYSKMAGIKRNWPTKDVFFDTGWNSSIYSNTLKDGLTYEKQLAECKKYKSANEYDNALNKDRYFYATCTAVMSRWKDKDLFEDCGWVNMRRIERASYSEHVNFCKKYKSKNAYEADKSKDVRYYSSARNIVRTWPKENFIADVGWVVNTEKFRPKNVPKKFFEDIASKKLSNREIAEKYDVSISMVKRHKSD